MAQSYKEYPSGSVTLTAVTYAVPFKYLSIDDVNVIGFDGEKWTPLTLDASAPRSATNKTVTLATAPNALYTKIRLYRASSTTQLVDFQNGSRLSESDLDTAYQQGLFVAQEIAEDASTTQFTAVREAGMLSGTSLSNFASEEIVSDATNGLIDGTNAVFTLTAFTPQTEVAEAYRVSIDGVMQSPTDAYTISKTLSQITFTSAPPTGSKIVVVTAASAASAVSVDDVTIGLTSANKVEIKNLGVTNDKLAGSITQDKLAGSIAQDKLAGLSITNSELAGSIATSKLAEVITDDTFTTGVSYSSLASSSSIKAYADASPKAQMKADDVLGASVGANTESVTLPNGLIMKTGLVTASGNSATDVNFAESFSGTISAQLTIKAAGATDMNQPIKVESLANHKLQVRNTSSPSRDVYWLVIGY